MKIRIINSLILLQEKFIRNDFRGKFLKEVVLVCCKEN
jgi:hypothetical protein